MDIKAALKQLPEKPGTYMMLDGLGNTIYVGKAINLKRRVSQYFGNRKDREHRITDMVNNTKSVEWTVTDTELDAFIEECRLIRELKPRYNRQMKKVRGYIYIKVPSEEFPKLAIAYEKTDDGAEYYGPFANQYKVELAIAHMNDLFKLRKCSTPTLVRKVGRCLYGQLGTCSGVCTGQVDIGDYRERLDKLGRFLNGRDMGVLQELTDKINSAVERLEFEKASNYHDYLVGLQHVVGRQRLAKASNRLRNMVAYEPVGDGRLKLFLIKGNRLLHRELLDSETVCRPGFIDVLSRLVRDSFALHTGMKEVSREEIDEARIIHSYLRVNKERIRSFWIPSSRLSDGTTALDDTLSRIVGRIAADARSTGAVCGQGTDSSL